MSADRGAEDDPGAPTRDGPDRNRPADSETPRTLHLETLRTARMAILGGTPHVGPRRRRDEDPGSAAGSQPAEIWYVLHGYRQLAHRFIRRFEAVARSDRLVVAPEALSRFYLRGSDEPGHGRMVGASWMTRDDRELEIRDYVRYLNRMACEVERASEGERGPVSGSPTRVVLGFSQGVHTAARWVALGSRAPDRLVLWGATLPPDLRDDAAERLRGTEVVVVRGAADGYRRAEEEAREEAWLEAAGVDYRVVEHPGGHEIEPGVLREIAASDGPAASD